MKAKKKLLKQIPKKGMILAIIILACVLLFIINVIFAPEHARLLKLNSVNGTIILFFLLLILLFGIILGRTKEITETFVQFDTNLTEREKEIVLLILQRKKNIDIANTLFVELSTIKSHINNIYKKEGVKNRKDIIEKYKSLLKKNNS